MTPPPMIKTIASIAVLSSGLLFINIAQAGAYTLTANKGDATLLIGKQKKELTKGKSIQLKAGTMVCFKSGNGVIKIKGDDYSSRLSKRTSPCKTLPEDVDEPVFSIQNAKNKILKLSATTGEGRKRATARSTSTKSISPRLVTIDGKEYFVIETKEWSRNSIEHIIKLQLIKEDGSIKAEYIDSNDSETGITRFILPKEDVIEKDGKTYTIRIIDAPLMEGKFDLNTLKKNK